MTNVCRVCVLLRLCGQTLWHKNIMRQKRVFLPPDDEETHSCHIWYNNGPKYIQSGLHTSSLHVPLHVNLVAFYCILCWVMSLVVNWCFSVKYVCFGSVFPLIALFIYFYQFLCGLLQYMRVLWLIKRSNSLKSSVPSPIWPRFSALLAEDVWTFRCNRGFFLK